MSEDKKVYQSLGLAVKAGQAASGAFACEEAVRKRKALLLILAGDASAVTKKKFSNMAAYYGIPLVEFGSMSELGKAMGKDERAVAVVTGTGFAQMIRQNLDA